nr:immunoglobulin heavy chain junction region [Homo sapiens]
RPSKATSPSQLTSPSALP